MKNNKKDIQYQIVKSEACGHVIEYKMIKKEHELEKARVDEGKSAKEKKKQRFERNKDELEGKKPWKPHKRGDIGVKEERYKNRDAGERTSKMINLRHDLEAKHGKKPSNQDLEYPMASSEKECDCEDKTKKCECEDKEMKKKEKFYIQKIQELRKQDPTAANRQAVSNAAGSAWNWVKSKFNNPNDPTYKNRQAVGQGIQNLTNPPTESPARERMNRRYGVSEQKSAPAQKLPAQQPTAEAIQNASELIGNKPNMSMENKLMSVPQKPTSNMSIATQDVGAKQNIASDDTAPAAQKYDMKNPFKVENAKNFKDAFDQARRGTGGGGNVFEYGGKKYHTYTQDEFKNPEKSGVPTDNKFYKDWQARKDTTGPNAYYANKTNPAPAPQTTAAQPKAQVAGMNPAPAPQTTAAQPKAQVTGMNPDGSISSTESDRRKTLTNPKNTIQIARPHQMGMAPALNEPGKVGMKIPGASVEYPEAPGFKFGDTATTQAPTSEQAEGNLKYNKNNKLNSNMG
jgi:hypothetical protein